MTTDLGTRLYLGAGIKKPNTIYANKWKVVLVLVLLVSLLDFASTPRIRHSRSPTTANPARIQQLTVVSPPPDMVSRLAGDFGEDSPAADLGFREFGDHLANQATAVFRKHGIIASKVPPGGDSVARLIITPQRRSIHANPLSTRVSHEYTMSIADPNTGAVRWQASLELSTWRGTSFLTRIFPDTLLDEELARKFLDTVIRQMKADEVI